MNMNEIATAARHNIPVIQVVINNHVLGMVRQWQNLFYGQRYSATVLNDAVDFVKLAEAMGAEGVRVATQEEFKEAFANALKSGHPVVIDCQIDSDDKVLTQLWIRMTRYGRWLPLAPRSMKLLMKKTWKQKMQNSKRKK